MEIVIVKQPITRAEITRLAREQFGDMIKAVVDVNRGVMALGGELHADEEAILLAGGSLQADLWGINLYPETAGAEWIEFDSMINLRPSLGNRSRGVEDPQRRAQIVAIVTALVQP